MSSDPWSKFSQYEENEGSNVDQNDPWSKFSHYEEGSKGPKEEKKKFTYQRAKELSKREAAPDFRSAPRLAMQGTIGALELLSLVPELGIESATRLADALGANGLTQKYEGGRKFGETLATAPFRSLGIKTEPETKAEEIAREVPGVFALTKAGGEIAPKIGRKAAELAKSTTKKLIPESTISKKEQAFNELVGSPISKTMRQPIEEASEALSGIKEYKPLEAKRIKISAEKLGIEFPSSEKLTLPEPTQQTAQHQARQRIGRTISEGRFENESSGGLNLRKAIQERAKEQRKQITSDYENAERLYQGEESPFLEGSQEDNQTIRQKLINNKNKLTDNGRLKTEQLNSSEKVVVNQIDHVLDILGEEGKVIPISSVLRKTKSLSSSLVYEDVYGGSKDILKSVVHDLNDSVMRELKSRGVNIDEIKKADRNFADWSNKYSNDEISPYMKRGIERSPEKIFDKFLNDPGTFRAVSEAIGPENEKLLSIATRNLVETRMSKYIKDLKKVGTPEYTDEIVNLAELIGKEKTKVIDNEFKRLFKTRFPHGIEEKKIPLPSPLEKMLSGKTKIKQSEIKTKISSAEGRKEIKEKLKEVPNGEKLYENLMRSKMNSELKGGKVRGTPTFEDMYKVLNKEENYDFWVEQIGQENVDKFLDLAEKEGKKKIFAKLMYKAGLEILDKTILSKFIKFFALPIH